MRSLVGAGFESAYFAWLPWFRRRGVGYWGVILKCSVDLGCGCSPQLWCRLTLECRLHCGHGLIFLCSSLNVQWLRWAVASVGGYKNVGCFLPMGLYLQQVTCSRFRWVLFQMSKRWVEWGERLGEHQKPDVSTLPPSPLTTCSLPASERSLLRNAHMTFKLS
jgi:hypothetical protein